MLDKMDVDHVADNAETWEKVIRKLRGGMMPPTGRPRPASDDVYKLISWLETSLDQAGAAKPNPGRASIHRLNRTEYGNAIRDLYHSKSTFPTCFRQMTKATASTISQTS
jgi:hypothetical protein